MKNYKLVRYIEFGHLFELFFFSSILTIFVIRIFLQLTGFPQIGSGVFHIAHLLFGGFFMLASIIGFITYLNNDLRQYFAILGGIGFGTFIDELGKFITSDNNYFFQPTIAIIYVIFVLLYLLFKTLEQKRNFSKEEYLVNSINSLEDLVIQSLDRQEKEKALKHLAMSDKENPLVKFLTQTFSQVGSLPEEKMNFYQLAKKRMTALYNFFLKKPWFLRAVAFFFILRAAYYLLAGGILISFLINRALGGTLGVFLSSAGILASIQLLAITTQAIFTIIGVLEIGNSRRKAYIFFRNAVLVSIFVLQIFNFYNNPLQALFSTTADLLLVGILSYMIRVEK